MTSTLALPLPVLSDRHRVPDFCHAGVRRVLIVDDSAAHLSILARLLTRWGYEVTEARSGEEALARAAEAAPDLVLSDWVMPGMDGITLCRRFRDMDDASFCYFILLSSRREKSEIAQGLDSGADDYLSKPVHAQELRARIHSADRIVRMQRELSTKNAMISDTLEELQGAYAAIDRDLRHARRIQASLVPERCCEFGPVRVSLLLQPCGHVGGDLVGAFPVDGGQVALFGLDVSGHGIASSMVAARIAGYLGEGIRESPGAAAPCAPEQVAQRLNARLAADPGVEEYLTMLYALIDPATGDLRMVQAGHPNPLLLRRDGSVAFVGSGGLPIGLVDQVSHELCALRLSPGDRLLIYSDGFVEAQMRGGGQLGDAGLVDLVRGVPADREGTAFLDALFAALVDTMPPSARLSDDVSAALVDYTGPA